MKIEDPRVRFYLKHRQQFDEWFDLRSDAAKAVDEWLLSLAPDVELLAADLGEDVQFRHESKDDNAWPGFYLVRTSWPKPAAGTPMIGMQWARRKTFMVGTSAPWMGVRADRKQAWGRAVYRSPAFQARRQERKDASTQWWQSLRYVIADDRFPEHADGYRATLLDGLRATWIAYSPSVDDALNTTDKGIRTDRPGDDAAEGGN